LSTLIDLCHKHPDLARFILITAGAAVTVPLLLEIAGFSALGPVVGTFAAFWQSSIGDVAAGSFFAWLQSAGMLGTGAGIGAGVGALVAFAGYLWVQVRKHGDERKERSTAVRKSEGLLHRVIRAGIW